MHTAFEGTKDYVAFRSGRVALYRLQELAHNEHAAIAVGACRAIGVVGADLRRSLVAAGLLPGEGDAIVLARERRAMVNALLRATVAARVSPDRVGEELKREPDLTRGRVMT